MNPADVYVRMHQPNQIGSGDIAWDEMFLALRGVAFDGSGAVTVFGWKEDDADVMHRRMLDWATSVRLTSQVAIVRLPDATAVSR